LCKKTPIEFAGYWRVCAGCRILRFSAAFAALWLLAACASWQLPMPRLDFLRQDETVQTDIAPSPLTFLVWQSSPAEEKLLQGWVSTYTQARPHVQIDLQFVEEYEPALQAALTGESPPDILAVNSFFVPDLIEGQRVALAPVPPAYISDIAPALRSAFLVDDQLACLPRDANTLALFYNKTRFDKAALPYPQPQWSWQEMQSAATTLTDKDNGLYGLVLDADMSRWLPFFFQAGGSLSPEQSASEALVDAAALTALETYVNMFWEGIAAEPVTLDSTWAGEAFGRGAAAMTIEGSWLVPFLADQFPDVQYGIVELPAGPAGRATVAFASCYAVSAQASDQAAALEFAGLLAHPDHLIAWAQATGNLPPLHSLGPVWSGHHPDKAVFLNSLAFAHLWQLAPGFQEVVASFNSSLSAAIAGDISVQEVLNRTRATADTLVPP
jgi:multiple sugar transport system substrate-binding protein